MSEQSATMLERRLGEAFEAMVADEAPTAVTVADLIESGRRQARRRRARAAFGLSAVMITATACVIGVVAGTGHAGGTTGPAKGGAKPSATATMGTRTDPAAPIVAFGWLPPDRSGEYEISQSATGGNYNAIDPKTGRPALDGPGTSGIQVWGPGNELLNAFVQGRGSGIYPGMTFTPAGTVQGHPAFWAAGTPGTTQGSPTGYLVLMWQYEPDAWVTVSLANAATSTANGDMLLNVAQHLKIGPANPAALPFHVPVLPAGIRPGTVDIDLPHQSGPQAGYAALRLCAVSPCVQTGGGVVISQGSTTWTSHSVSTVDHAPQLPRSGAVPADGVPVDVGGHAALLWTNSSGATLSFTYGTARVVIQAADEEYQALGGRDGFLAFCRTLTWLGADPAHWTTHVLG